MRLPFAFAALAAASAVARAQTPVNDDPAGAIAVSVGVNPSAPSGVSGSYYSNVGATASTGYVATCGLGAGSDVFFSFAPTVAGVHVFALCTPAGFLPGGLGDGILNVYDAAAPTTSLVCDDNACFVNGPGSASNLPQASVALAAGATYLVRVSVSGITAPGDFYLTVLPATTAGGGETCATTTLVGDGVYAGNAFGVTASGVTYPGCVFFTATTLDLYYDYVPAATGIMILQREGGAATRMAVTSGPCGAESLVAGTCTSGGYLAVPVVAGTVYHLRFGPTAAPATAALGAFLFGVRLLSAALNDACASATPLVLGDNAGSTVGATPDAATPACSGFTVATALDNWFSYAAPSNGNLAIRLLGVNAMQMATYVGGSCGALPTATCATAGVSGHLAAVQLTAGQTVFVRVGQSSPTGVGVFNLRLDFAPAPANDDCAGATALALGPNGPFSNAGATDGSVVSGCFGGSNDLWFTFVAPLSGRVRFSGCGSTGDVGFAVFSSCGGAETACDDDDAANAGPCATTAPTAPFLEVDVVAGTAYLLRAAGETSAAVSVSVDVSYRFSLTVVPNVGAGTIVLSNVAGTPGAAVVNAVTFYAGNYPNGWLYGVDPPFAELNYLLSFGPPFLATLNGAGALTHTFGNAPLPLNLTLYGVGVELGASGSPVRGTAPVVVNL